MDLSHIETRVTAPTGIMGNILMLNNMHYSGCKFNFFSPEQAAVSLLLKRYAPADAKSFIQGLVILLQSASFPFRVKISPAFTALTAPPHPALINMQEISTCLTKFIHLTF